ncbi:MAG: acyl-CoA dehydrogenase family protein [Alphaproteobacteria bacterium]|jgi:acyl-CoA dehydrogenase|nr:acyl-CoA dehydrogenase [Rhodospirillaceae bacterium]MDP6020033.1 acyl-CoA dehydrogenase family protein [Alphaproteobacteria bacterium]|tara:strand:- start:2804 stop:3988 length:1185 start_codon:yes stop_codon:yes gene_type:complete
MDFAYTSEQEGIRQSIQSLMKDFPDEYWMARDQAHEFPMDFHDAIAKAGYLGLVIPEEYGGSGLGITEAGIALMEVAASGAAFNGASSIHLSIFGINPVVKHGSEEMRQKYLPRVVSGDLHICFGVTEPDAGTDTTRISTRAVRDGDRYIINGKKVWLTKAGDSQKVLLLTRTTPLEECKKRTDGMTLFFADLDPSAVTIRPISKMGRNAVASNEVFFDNLSVPATDLVGQEGRGFHHLLDGLNPERILGSYEGIGVGRAALNRATQYAKDRHVFGRPIGENQGIQLPLADSLARLHGAELAAQKAAWLYDTGQPCGTEANIAKFLAGEAAFQAADRAVQTHGGFGYASEYHVERYFREARLLRIAPISENLILAGLAEHVLGLPRSYGRSDGS